MQIVPVLDLLEGVVVRGVAGKRSEYRPIVSRLSANPNALAVARAFRDQLGLSRLYVADLDAILHGRPNLETFRALADDGFELLVDAGLRDMAAADRITGAGAARLIAGLETWPGPDELERLCRQLGADRVIFSLDLHAGIPVVGSPAWGSCDPYEIGCLAARAGVTGMIVLDVAQVGVGAGITTVPLCRRLMQSFPDLSLITGGGVRNAADLQQLDRLGIHGVLIASALHDGSIGTREIATISGSGT